MSDEEEARTIFVRSTTLPIGPAMPETPMRAGGRLQPGDVLNGIYEVRRFVAAGGMGEVWEGISVHSDERVAIKVMLPHLAQDPNVVAMFRKEAATLTRLAHPALVSYRMLAMEPVLSVLYIVTEYVDGSNLADKLRDVPRDPATLRRVTRRLAEGLLVAHEAGAVHRDLSPDNVLLEGGDIARARIIDFGIAKDLDAAKGTIVGDGFAGKLGYVAPEQLGDFGRAVGPWTDVYSLGLIILAVAEGRAPDMGATLVDAVDRRRAGVDVAAVPEPLRAVLAAMLRANPAERLCDMGAVITALDAAGGGATKVSPPPRQRRAPRPSRGSESFVASPKTAVTAGATPARATRWIAAASAGALVVGGIGWWATRPSGPSTLALPAALASRSGIPAAAPDPLLAVRAALPSIGCSWLDARAGTSGGRTTIEVSGVAGDGKAVREAVYRAAPSAAVTTSAILPLDPSLCGAVDAFRAVRAAGAPLVTVPKADWELDQSAEASGVCQGQKIAKIPFAVDPRVAGRDWSVAGIDSTRFQMTGMAASDILKQELKPQPDGRAVSEPLGACGAGVKAWIVIRGVGPYDTALSTSRFDAAWRDRFLATAKANGWSVDMAWYRLRDLTPN